MHVKHQATARRKWYSARRTVRTHMPSPLPPLIYLTDPKRTPNPEKCVEFLPFGSGIIYRHYNALDKYDVANRLKKRCVHSGVLLLISGDPELASELKIAGVHWPEKWLPKAAKWRGKFRLQTASAHSRLALSRAAQAGMDAALVSTVFPSQSPSAGPALGAVRFRQLCQTAPCPVYGLGGINANNSGQIATHAGLASIQGLQDVFAG